MSELSNENNELITSNPSIPADRYNALTDFDLVARVSTGKVRKSDFKATEEMI